jgi:hypothetical protein
VKEDTKNDETSCEKGVLTNSSKGGGGRSQLGLDVFIENHGRQRELMKMRCQDMQRKLSCDSQTEGTCNEALLDL